MSLKVILDVELVVKHLGIDSESFKKFSTNLLSSSKELEIKTDKDNEIEMNFRLGR